MKLFTNMSLPTRIATITGSLLLFVTTLLFAVSIYAKEKDQNAFIMSEVRSALVIFAQILSDEFAVLADAPTREGAAATLLRYPGSLAISEEIVDRVSRMSGSEVTYFEFDRASGEFVRLMTSIRRADGTRAIGTILDPAGSVKPALLAGRSFVGTADILGVPHITVYDPVFGPDGQVAGAIFSGVTTADVRAKTLRFAGLLLLPTVVLLAIGLGLMYVMLRRNFRPLGQLVSAIRSLEQRNYAVDIPQSLSNDEVGDLFRACISLRDDLQEGQRESERARQFEAERMQERAALDRVIAELRGGLSRLAEGDLTAEIANHPDDPFPSAYEPLRVSFNTVAERFEAIIDEVLSIAEAVRDSAEGMAGASRNLSSRAETQAATLEESAAALTELTRSVSETADLATRAQEASNGNKTGAEQGAQIMHAAVAAMQGIEQASEQITRIIGVIEDIAFQTNLLALNAGVEAARAGDAGRGFAVVASEVRLLAQRASDSAREIKGLISDSGERVSEGSSLVRKTGDSLAEILGRANEAATLVTEIAMAASEQARGLSEVNSGISQLDTVTQQNSAMAEESSVSSKSLLSQSEELIHRLAGLRTRGARRARPTQKPQAAGTSGADTSAKIVQWGGNANGTHPPQSAIRAATGTWAEF